MNTPRFTNIAEVKQANKSAGFYWYSPDTVRVFKPRVETRIYDAGTSVDYPEGSRVWVESTTTYNGVGREYKIPRFNVATGDINYTSVDYRTLVFSTKANAVKFLESNPHDPTRLVPIPQRPTRTVVLGRAPMGR